MAHFMRALKRTMSRGSKRQFDNLQGVAATKEDAKLEDEDDASHRESLPKRPKTGQPQQPDGLRDHAAPQLAPENSMDLVGEDSESDTSEGLNDASFSDNSASPPQRRSLHVHFPDDAPALPPRPLTSRPALGTKPMQPTYSSAQFVSRRSTPRVAGSFFGADENDEMQLNTPVSTPREALFFGADNANVDDHKRKGTFTLVRHNHHRELKEALTRGIDVNARDDRGNTLLIVAAQNNHVKIARLLLSRGAAVNAQNITGNTALYYAVTYNYREVYQVLCEAGANQRQLTSNVY